MLALLQKDFKLLFSGGKVGNWRAVSYVLNFFLVALFITVEIFVVSGVLKRLQTYDRAPLAFLSIALFIVSVIMTLICLIQAKKLFFNDKDMSNLAMMPIRNSQIILSKLFFLFLFQYIMGLLFSYPIIASYAVIFNRGRKLFYLGLFYPLLAFPFECGVALIFMYPYKFLGDFLKKHPIVQFIVAVIFVLGLCILYSQILNIFVSLVAGGNFNSILSGDNINAMISARKYMIPTTWLVEIFFERIARTILVELCVSVGVLLIGISICVITFNRMRTLQFQVKPKAKEHKAKLLSPTKMLVKKEFTILFKDSGNLFSFTGLLVVQPFLVYLIISSLNTIFASGVFSYYVALLPTFLPIIDVLITILTGLIIAQGANVYIANESKNIRLIKILPVDVFKQLLVKMALPLVFVMASELVTFAVLLIFGCLNIWTALFGFVLTLMIQCIFSVISLYEELRVRHDSQRSYFLSSTFSYLIPILYSAAMIVASYFGMSIYVAYIIGFAIIIASGVPFVVRFKSRAVKMFNDLEVVN